VGRVRRLPPARFEARFQCEEQKALSYTISTLLTRNLDDVFGENDPARRRAAIDEIFTDDGVFHEPNGISRNGPSVRQSSATRRRTVAALEWSFRVRHYSSFFSG
jgi:hypothetical protein